MSGPVPNPTLIYHITHVDNLTSIIADGGLHAKIAIKARGIQYVSIAYNHIQDRRERTSVPCGPGGTLHDYVPFSFAPRSPMLYTINRGNVPGCEEGQEPILHLVTSTQAVDQEGLGFVFTDGHGIMEVTRPFESLSSLSEIDWPLMKAQYWNDTNEDPDRKRRRQAEFLVYRFVPWGIIKYIGVINQRISKLVEGKLVKQAYQPSILVKRGWYY